MPIEINHKADKFKCELSNIETILNNLELNPNYYNKGSKYQSYIESENRID